MKFLTTMDTHFVDPCMLACSSHLRSIAACKRFPASSGGILAAGSAVPAMASLACVAVSLMRPMIMPAERGTLVLISELAMPGVDLHVSAEPVAPGMLVIVGALHPSVELQHVAPATLTPSVQLLMIALLDEVLGLEQA